VDDYLPILILIILGFLFASLSFVASALLAPKKRPTAAKIAPYECGIVPGIEPPTRFPVRFYLVAMIFIIFDIEVVFLYPWAVIFRQLRSFGLVEVLVFAAVHLVRVPGRQRRPQLGPLQADARRHAVAHLELDDRPHRRHARPARPRPVRSGDLAERPRPRGLSGRTAPWASRTSSTTS
jgi:NADH-quinone oxidoreductase subunit A